MHYLAWWDQEAGSSMGMFNPDGFRERGNGDSPTTPRSVVALPREPGHAPALLLPRDPVLVIYASETGVAEHLAHDACRILQHAGVASSVLAFDELRPDTLQVAGQVLFLASTCYDGDPPDMAEDFCRQHMRRPMSLPQLRYGLLSLGDSYYDEFCGFGRRLHRWLQASGAQTLFEPVEMDDEDEAAARRWHDNVSLLIRLRVIGRGVAA